MGYGTYETTHENVIKSGKRLFMQNGSVTASIRLLTTLVQDLVVRSQIRMVM